MAPAPYTRATLDKMRQRAAYGAGVHQIAAELAWAPEQVRKVARRHEIAVVEDGPAWAKMVKPQAPETVPVKSHPEKSPTKQQGGKYRNTLSPHPRTKYVSAAISVAAARALDDFAHRIGKSKGAVAGYVLDFICRTRRLDDLIIAADGEVDKQ